MAEFLPKRLQNNTQYKVIHIRTRMSGMYGITDGCENFSYIMFHKHLIQIISFLKSPLHRKPICQRTCETGGPVGTVSIQSTDDNRMCFI